MKRKVIYHAAISLDGYMAREDGSFDCFAMQGPHVDDFIADLGRYDTALMGRKTYDVGLQFGVSDPYPNLDTYVFSRTLEPTPGSRVKIVASNASQLVRDLKAQAGKDIWLVGAGNFAAELFAEDLIDEVVVKVNPLLLGQGVSLVQHLPIERSLHLTASKPYENGVVLLSYRVEAKKAASS